MLLLLGLVGFIVSPVQAAPGVLIQQYEDPTGTASGNFGESVASVNGQPIIGAPDVAGGGKAYLYDTGATPHPLRTFTPPASLSARAFGRALATHGQQILISDTAARPVVNPDSFYGAVMQYTGPADTNPIVIPNPGPGTSFGSSLDLAPNGRFAVGDPFLTSGSLAQTGRVYVFSGSNSTPALILDSPLNNSQVRFGRDVAFFEDEPVSPPTTETSYEGALAVGAPGAGRVYLFNPLNGSLQSTITNPLGGSGDFGSALATWGQKLIVGAPLVTVEGRTFAGNVFVIDRSTGILERILKEPTPTKNRYFGSDVAVLGSNYLIVGTRPVTGAAGKTYVYNLNTGAVVLTLTSPHTDRVRFGTAVAAAGANILVGDPQGITGAASGPAGQAFLYSGPESSAVVPNAPTGLSAQAVSASKISLNWIDNAVNEQGFVIERKRDDEAVFTPIATVAANVATYDDQQGLLPQRNYCYQVKAFNADGSSAYSNTACATTLGTGGEDLIGSLPNPGAAGDAFGFSLARTKLGVLAGLAVGAPGADANQTTNSGKAYIYVPPSTSPRLALSNPDPHEEDAFGYSVAAIGNSVLVGAPGPEMEPGAETDYANPNNPLGVGGRVFMFNGSTGVLERTITAPDEFRGLRFGHSVGAFGRTQVVIGAPETNHGAGQVFVLNLVNGKMTRHTNPRPFDEGYGHAVAPGRNLQATVISWGGVCDDGSASLLRRPRRAGSFAWSDGYSASPWLSRFIVGAPLHNGCGGEESGYAFLFQDRRLFTLYPSPNGAMADGFGFSVSGGRKYVGIGAALYDAASADDTGRAYLYPVRSAIPKMTLANPIGGAEDLFGHAIAVVEGVRRPQTEFLAVGAPNADTVGLDSGAVFLYNIPKR